MLQAKQSSRGRRGASSVFVCAWCAGGTAAGVDRPDRVRQTRRPAAKQVKREGRRDERCRSEEEIVRRTRKRVAFGAAFGVSRRLAAYVVLVGRATRADWVASTARRGRAKRLHSERASASVCNWLNVFSAIGGVYGRSAADLLLSKAGGVASDVYSSTPKEACWRQRLELTKDHERFSRRVQRYQNTPAGERG